MLHTWLFHCIFCTFWASPVKRGDGGFWLIYPIYSLKSPGQPELLLVIVMKAMRRKIRNKDLARQDEHEAEHRSGFDLELKLAAHPVRQAVSDVQAQSAVGAALAGITGFEQGIRNRGCF